MKFNIGDLFVNLSDNFFIVIEVKDNGAILRWIDGSKIFFSNSEIDYLLKNETWKLYSAKITSLTKEQANLNGEKNGL